jgi:hypothetical protein
MAHGGGFTSSHMKSGRVAGFHPKYIQLSDAIARIFEAEDREGRR